MLTLSVVVWVLSSVGGWMIFEKAGVRGWVALIPVLNLFGVLKIVGWSPLWILAFISPVAPVAFFLAAVLVARRFGRGLVFGVGLCVLPFLFAPLLGFGEARYRAQ